MVPDMALQSSWRWNRNVSGRGIATFVRSRAAVGIVAHVRVPYSPRLAPITSSHECDPGIHAHHDHRRVTVTGRRAWSWPATVIRIGLLAALFVLGFRRNRSCSAPKRVEREGQRRDSNHHNRCCRPGGRRRLFVGRSTGHARGQSTLGRMDAFPDRRPRPDGGRPPRCGEPGLPGAVDVQSRRGVSPIHRRTRRRAWGVHGPQSSSTL